VIPLCIYSYLDPCSLYQAGVQYIVYLIDSHHQCAMITINSQTNGGYHHNESHVAVSCFDKSVAGMSDAHGLKERQETGQILFLITVRELANGTSGLSNQTHKGNHLQRLL